MKKILLLILLLPCLSFPQQFRMMTYNILNYPGSDASTRNPLFRSIVEEANPDIVVVQEIISQTGVDNFLNNVLNTWGNFTAGTFVNGPDTDNAIFFKDSLFEFISNTRVPTSLRDINAFKMVIKASLDTFIVYSAHLKASQGSAEEAQRASEAAQLRIVTNSLPAGTNFFAVGDFNLYTSSEQAYQNLLNQSQPGYFLDPINTPGTWHNNFSFRFVHTQSTRGGNGGGVDDRFDFILISQAIQDAGGIDYINGTYKAFGNDGNHFNNAINASPTNTVVSQQIADALFTVSDHLPVVADFAYEIIVPVELISFTADYVNNRVNLSWSTATEVNSHGFEIQRSSNETDWKTVDFINSAGNSTETKLYSYTDYSYSGEKYYRLKMVDLDGTYKYSNVLTISTQPQSFQVYQNYPNPFNNSTTISFYLPVSEYVNVTVYNMLGQEVETLINGQLETGLHKIDYNADNLTSGMYIYKVSSEGFSETRKFILLK